MKEISINAKKRHHMKTQISLPAMLRTGTALIFAILTHAVTECEWGKYGDDCDKRCPPNCQVNQQRNLTHCNKDTGECSDGCIPGWYASQCDQPCSKNWCSHQNGRCEKKCSGNTTGDFCEVTGVSTRTYVKMTTDETTGLSKADVAVIITISLVAIIVIIVVTVVIKRRRQIYNRRKSTRRPKAGSDPENPEGEPLLSMKEIITSSLSSFTVRRNNRRCTLRCTLRRWSSAAHSSDMAPMTILCVACIMMFTRADLCKVDQHCSDCDSTIGYCISECEPGYFDQKCSSTCNENCRNKKCTLSINGNDNCTEGCVPGYQGPGCSRPCYNPGGVCTACPGGCDGGYCQLGSSCVSGCVDSYYGSGCKTCHRGCKTCNSITGTCKQCHPSFRGPNCEQETNTTRGCEGGCVPGHKDRDCKHCSDKCLNKTCRPKNKPLDKRCNPGFYGEHCNKTCGVCIDGDCDQMSGMCFRGCNRTTLGCEPSCRTNCTLAECDIDTCPQDEEKSDERDLHQSINMGLLTVLCLFVFCILITVCVCYCRKLWPHSERVQARRQLNTEMNRPERG